MPPTTAEEAEILRAYGRDIIFTPGDIVYSSSQLINLAPPVLKLEKLQLFMERHDVTFADMRRTLDKLAGHRIHVVGDTIVDSYTHCAMIGGQTKTPTMSVMFERKTDFIVVRRLWPSTAEPQAPRLRLRRCSATMRLRISSLTI